MNSKTIAIIVVVILLGGGWYVMNNADSMPVEENVETETPIVETSSDTFVNTDTDTTIDDSIESSIDMSDNRVTFNVTGVDHSFDVKEMTVKKGQTVTINFKNEDGFHDWVLDEFEGAATPKIQAGQLASVTFVADTAGTFEYYCSVGNHRARGMVGTFVVTE